MTLAFVMVNTVSNQMKRVLEKIKEINGVEEAYRLYGLYDILAVVKTETTEELKKPITHIRRLEHALTSLTLLVVS